VWALYPVTPVKAHLTLDEDMVSIMIGPCQELQLDFLDLEPLDRIVSAAKQARRWLRDIDRLRRES
jgi:hypothetical protein